MPPIIRFIASRLFSIFVTLFIVTAVLFGIVMLTPPDIRATLYMPKTNRPLTDEQYQALVEKSIEKYHLRDPYPVQYVFWLSQWVRGNWGWSPILNDDVLKALIRRTPVTAELTLYSLLVFIPLGLVSGVVAAQHRGRSVDHYFRLSAFIATSLPIFTLAVVLMAIFYVMLPWFPPERLSTPLYLFVKSTSFHQYTGLLTVDGILNGRLDISLDASRHLILPVFALSLAHWATLGRIMRSSMIEELQEDYITAAKARGIPMHILYWQHAFRNALSPALASSALSAASLFTGVSVIEIIFNIKGVSEMFLQSFLGIPDAAPALSFAIYSVIVVLIVMLGLDVIQAIIDPRIRESSIS